jgi:hypothetical protein
MSFDIIQKVLFSIGTLGINLLLIWFIEKHKDKIVEEYKEREEHKNKQQHLTCNRH